MKDVYQKYFFLLICIIFLILPAIIALNYFVDRFEIYSPSTPYIETKVTPNERALKFSAFSKNSTHFDAIVFGSSRSSIYHTRIFKELFNLNTFNFGVSSESYHGCLRKLRWAIHNNCPLKTIFLPISADELSYMIDYSLPPYTLRRMDPPEIVEFKNYKTTFNRIYLLSVPATLGNLNYMFFERQNSIRLKYTTATGDIDHLWDEQFKIKECPDQELYKNESLISKMIGLLKNISQAAENEGISVVLIWNPLPIDQQLRSRQILDVLNNIKSQYPFIQRIPLNDKRLRDSDYYHDPGHFKRSLAMDALLPRNKVLMERLIQEIKSRQNQCQKMSLSL